LRAIYYPLELYANHAGKIALDVLTSSPLFATKRFGDQPYLDVLGTYDEAKTRVALAVVNRRREGDVIGSVELEGARAKPGGRAFLVAGESTEASNTFQNPHAVGASEAILDATGSRFEYRFPRHSISWLEFEVVEGSS
jgi:alpha-L-arabinofuranosidase